MVVSEIHFRRIRHAETGSYIVTQTPCLTQLCSQADKTAPAFISVGCRWCFVTSMTLGIQLLRRHFGVVVTDTCAAAEHVVPLDLVRQRETIVGGFHRVLNRAGGTGYLTTEVVIVAV